MPTMTSGSDELAGIAGLTSVEAAARLQQAGPNDPAPRRRSSAIRELLRLFLNPLVSILLIAAVVSAFLGETVDAGIIAAIVLLSVAVEFVQTYRSERAIDELRERVAPTAIALRDGEWREIRRADVVPGDVVRLSAGDLVPADARLLVGRDLYVQQAALTGESLPVEKQAAGTDTSTRPNAANMVFLGTSVVSGTATATVVATGAKTAFGDIAARLATRPGETAFDRGLKDFSLLLARTVLFLVVFLLGASVLLHREMLQSLLFVVALAVGLTPEFLPMITSVTLAKGARAMAEKKVIVKHLSAIQNFGSIDVLCSDKTGTITSGQMVLDRSLDPFGQATERAFALAYLNSRLETGIRSPLDAAILDRPEPERTKGYEKRDELPYDFERRRLSIVVEHAGERLLITKGSPEGILPLATSYEIEGRALPMNSQTLTRCKAIYEDLSRQGFRTLAVACAKVQPRPSYSVADERDLTLVGFLTFADPPLADAAGALAALQRDGVEVKIITGDGDLVTDHVCREVGLDPGKIVLGDELDRISDAALAQVAESTTIFARVSPAQKNRILVALKRHGHVVGFMGDGINDAPSLHAADVGISVSTAVDVAREAADIILVEPGLKVLHSGIVEGRKAFGNVMKYLLMGTSSNFGNMFSMAGASVFLPFLPMLPTQILLNNFLYDLAQISIPTDNVDDDYLRKPQHWEIQLIRNFMVRIGPISSLFDFLTFYVLLHFFHADGVLFHTGWFVESLATQTLVIFVIRTAQNPLRSRPSPALTATTLAIVVAGVALPFTSLAQPLGFTPLPLRYFLFLGAATVAYLLLVGAAKRHLLRRDSGAHSETKAAGLAVTRQ
ncbi:MAG TPA: magnesium-translocating P-type ATPase [Vicinamibacteria bacterium]|nr:magnesium-translocating P-type ATPase [Vicinamibacteria bacterium]